MATRGVMPNEAAVSADTVAICATAGIEVQSSTLGKATGGKLQTKGIAAAVPSCCMHRPHHGGGTVLSAAAAGKAGTTLQAARVFTATIVMVNPPGTAPQEWAPHSQRSRRTPAPAGREWNTCKWLDGSVHNQMQ